MQAKNGNNYTSPEPFEYSTACKRKVQDYVKKVHQSAYGLIHGIKDPKDNQVQTQGHVSYLLK